MLAHNLEQIGLRLSFDVLEFSTDLGGIEELRVREELFDNGVSILGLDVKSRDALH